MVDVALFKNEEEFRTWLEANANQASEIWVAYYRKSTGRPSLTWSSSVDVALCFGWIDGVRKSIDDQSFKIRFTPRKIGSIWSAVNIKKVEEQIELGNMKPEGLRLFYRRTDVKGYSVEDRNLSLSNEHEAKLRENSTAWVFFSGLAPSYKRESIWWIMSAKKEETQKKRLEELIACSEAALKIPNLRKK